MIDSWLLNPFLFLNILLNDRSMRFILFFILRGLCMTSIRIKKKLWQLFMKIVTTRCPNCVGSPYITYDQYFSLLHSRVAFVCVLESACVFVRTCIWMTLMLMLRVFCGHAKICMVIEDMQTRIIIVRDFGLVVSVDCVEVWTHVVYVHEKHDSFNNFFLFLYYLNAKNFHHFFTLVCNNIRKGKINYKTGISITDIFQHFSFSCYTRK